MIQVVSEFLGIVGVDVVPPSNLAELIPYLISVFIGLILVLAVFRVFAAILDGFFTFIRRV
ncbi:hypothetical protein [Clostridium minihomine]|uniref:hypothetical protein n=1 Tax=Clostridium minihomine TaxID=2045012 RepID=UPI000C78E359|nr:hypothetical protein [Clostridium minihomine]